jgi:hypothetical protein
VFSSEVVLLHSHPDPESVERRGTNRNCTLVTTVWLPRASARRFRSFPRSLPLIFPATEQLEPNQAVTPSARSLAVASENETHFSAWEGLSRAPFLGVHLDLDSPSNPAMLDAQVVGENRLKIPPTRRQSPIFTFSPSGPVSLDSLEFRRERARMRLLGQLTTGPPSTFILP